MWDHNTFCRRLSFYFVLTSIINIINFILIMPYRLQTVITYTILLVIKTLWLGYCELCFIWSESLENLMPSFRYKVNKGRVKIQTWPVLFHSCLRGHLIFWWCGKCLREGRQTLLNDIWHPLNHTKKSHHLKNL